MKVLPCSRSFIETSVTFLLSETFKRMFWTPCLASWDIWSATHWHHPQQAIRCNVGEPLIGGVMDPQAEEPEHPKHHHSRDFLVTTTPSPSDKMHFGLFFRIIAPIFWHIYLNQDVLHLYSFPSVIIFTTSGKVKLTICQQRSWQCQKLFCVGL